MRPGSWKEGGSRRKAWHSIILHSQQLPRDSNKSESKAVPLIVFQCFRTQSATARYCSKYLNFWFIQPYSHPLIISDECISSLAPNFPCLKLSIECEHIGYCGKILSSLFVIRLEYVAERKLLWDLFPKKLFAVLR